MSTTPEEMLSMLDGKWRTCVVCSEGWREGGKSCHLSHCEVPKVAEAHTKALAAAREEGRAEPRKRVLRYWRDRCTESGDGDPIETVLDTLDRMTCARLEVEAEAADLRRQLAEARAAARREVAEELEARAAWLVNEHGQRLTATDLLLTASYLRSGLPLVPKEGT